VHLCRPFCADCMVSESVYLNKKLVHYIIIAFTTSKLCSAVDAHDLACFRFLDTRMFATCSDDHTICLWDLRNMSQKVCTLRGHTDMVKNIEFVPHEGIILTSAFDGNVNTWDINWSVSRTNRCQFNGHP